MAAITIIPSVWVDDTGTVAAPNQDGTKINNAALQNDIYARVNELMSGVRPFTLGGRLIVEGFGEHIFSAGGTGNQLIRVRNTNAGTANLAALVLGNNETTEALLLLATSTTYTAGIDAPKDGGLLRGARIGGLTLSATHPSGAIRFFTGAGDENMMRLHASGGVSIGTDTDPGTGSLLVSQVSSSDYVTVHGSTPAPAGTAGAAVLFFDSGDNRTKLSNNNGTYLPVVQGEGCGLYHSGGQSIIGDGTYRPLTFDSEDFDDNGLHSTGTNPTRVTIVQTGRYLFIGHSGDLPTNSGSRLGFRINGSAVTGDVEQGDNQDRMMTSGIYALAAGQYIELVARHPSVTGNWGTSTRAQATQFMATRVG